MSSALLPSGASAASAVACSESFSLRKWPSARFMVTASRGTTLPGSGGLGLLGPLKNAKYAPAPPPPSTSTAATMMISIFLDFMTSSLRGVARGRREQRALPGGQGGQNDDLDAAVERRRAR